MISRRALLRQGAALLGLVALLALAITSLFVAGLKSAQPPLAAERVRNAELLALAKQALIGHAAQQAALAAETNPGRLPCPEAAGYFGTASEGIAAASCRLPAIGRLPWRTLGLDKPRDASGEALWYAVSPGWALPNVTTTLKINSDALGRLTLDEKDDAAVALIIAPGRPLQVRASPGCAAHDQRRRSKDVAGNPVVPYPRDYLECENATSPADLAFASRGPADSFNDQVHPVGASELLRAIEAAIAHRIEREVAPPLRSAYAGTEWGLSPANPMFPFAARFGTDAFNPDSYRGSAGTLQGLIPLTRSQGCDPAADSRCDTAFVAWAGAPAPVFSVQGGSTMAVYSGASFSPPSRCVATATQVQCTLYTSAEGTLNLAVSATAANVAMSLRRLDKTVPSAGFAPDSPSTPRAAGAIFNAAGEALVTFSGTVDAPGTPASCVRHSGAGAGPFACQRRSVAVPIELLADHSLLDPAHPVTGWFLRNEWHGLSYYAIAPGHAANGAAPRSCSALPPGCLSVVGAPGSERTRALLVLAGRSLPGKTRPSGDLLAYLDSEENRNADLVFEQRRIDASFNDRVIRIDSEP